MAKNKTVYTNENVIDFIENIDNEQKRKDSYALIKLMETALGERAKMWGPSIIGFGNYHYKYKSGHGGNAPILGFSPRKAAISLYVFTGLDEHQPLLEGLGKFTMGKACIYIKKLDDININVLNELMDQSIQYISSTYTRITE